ncbi:MAG: hypothetical protein ABFR53_11200 [Actinomycetota bacterium]
MAVVSFLIGLGMVVYVMQAAVRTVILPRATRVRLSGAVFGAVAVTFRWIAGRRKSYESQDGILAVIAPVGLLAVPVSWLVLLLVAFGFMFWATDPGLGVDGAFNLAGSSLTTLGFAAATGLGQQALAFAAALLGLGVLTLFITYLPSIYSAFQDRENKVALLEVRAGSPPSASEMLIRYHNIGWHDELAAEWASWEAWFAELEETHTTHLSLPWFRSTDPHRSWVTGAGTILDTASLWLSACSGRSGQDRAAAGLMIRAGYMSLRRVASMYKIPFDPDPVPAGPVAIQRAEFDGAYDALASAGIAMYEDRDQAWRDFVGWRVNYEAPLLGLAEMLRAPYAPWTSDRSSLMSTRRGIGSPRT